QLESEHALVRWLAQHILEPDSNASSQQLRLESDKHLVQIVTINPFATVIAANAASIPFTQGMLMRVLLLIVGYVLCVFWVMR
ncbi:hypothetical protein ONJ23_28000, partial [Salmonella enterica subsp. enterica serovar Virginia]|nr:hypothetical protein [Salmonella enterica subsp. enterica serovar Virginia]